ncbi:LysM peptidoglycan-binding domain-containing protein [Campylobacter rectus]|uniref:LysM peptidoglycan-binding domain-containing protein n=1 Tax=Campylobacter rectus TaxID=203 RepID=UPI000F5DECED|nr:LysM peptidoglycan-binding domain-containing protein [Campylobacter rectus]RRD53766.1 LysM peptidoglycan-binding domain-containing protein [Campylobacter rectus]
MAKIIIDGKEHEYTVLDGTAATYSMAANAVDLYTEKFSDLSMESKVKVKWATGLQSNAIGALVTFVQEKDKVRAVAKVGGSFIGGAAATTITNAAIAFAAGLGATLSAPVVIGIGVVGGVVLSTVASETAGELYDTVVNWFGHGTGKGKDFEIEANSQNNSISIECNSDKYPELKFVDHKATMKYNTYRCLNKITGFEFSFDKEKHTSKIKTDNANTEKQAIQTLTAIDDIKSVTLNSHTYDIKNLSNLEIRNAIDKIPQASFLLSNILIRTGEELDLGSKGIYKVKSGDTLSTIAQRNGMVTKELLKLNTWLVDEGRVKFLKNKVLVESNILELNEIDHVLVGDRNAENILIDANGGDDTLVGGNKKDILKGGEGFDTYYAGDKDIITDSDGKGEVYFDKTKLTGGTYDKEKKVYVSDDKSIEYKLSGDKLTVSKGGKSLTINKFTNSKKDPHLGIYLAENDDVEITVSDASAQEMKGVMSFDVSLNRTLGKGEYIDVLVKAKSDRQGSKEIEKKIRFKENDKVKTFEYFWNDDDQAEEDEKINVNASVIDKSKSLKAEVKKQGVGTIKDDDGDEISVTVSDEEELEATGKMTFKVSLSRVLNNGEYVNVSVNGENLEFLARDQTKEYIKTWGDDKDKQGDRTINAVATVGDVSEGLKVSVKRHGVGTIKDDDGDKIYVSISDASAKESEQKMSFDVSLSRALNKGEFVKLVVNGEVIEFGAGEKTKKYEYTWKDDKKVEADEKIDVFASVASKSPGLDVEFFKKGVGTIEDDDGGEVTVYTTSASAPEAAEEMTFFVSISRPLKEGEYVVASIYGQTVHFYEGSSTNHECKYTWKGEDDKIPEEDSKFKLTPSILDHSPGLKVKTESGTGTIIDDDKDPDDDDPENPTIPSDPLAIDLNRDGTRTLKLNGALNFDIDGNGFKEATGWISPEDAFLAYDRNENGIIDDGTELFGDKTVTNTTFGYTGKTAANGFEALKAFDSNNDNIIDEKDEKFDKLLLWQDKNSNAVTDKGELKTLREHNIKSIDLNYKNINSTNNGNFIRQTSKVTFNDGTTTTADDIWFSVDLKDTIQPDITIPNDIKALPEVHGFGNLYNLRSAMSKDSKLTGMIKEYMNLDFEAKQEKLDDILFRWTETENIDKTSRGGNIDARVLGAYEKITGKPFLQFGNNPNPWANAAITIKNRVKQFKDYLYASIELQTKYNGLLDTKYQYFNYDEKRFGYDFSKINKKLLQLYKDGKYEEVAILSDLVRKAGGYKPNLLDSFNANLTKLASGDKYFISISSSVPLYGTKSNDNLRGTGGNDLIMGNAGNDTLRGDKGNDTYVFNRGDGVDTIEESDDEKDRIDTLKFGEGITKVSYEDIKRLALDGQEIEGNNQLVGFSGNDTIKGGKGSDSIYGRAGDDTIYGNAGDDSLCGEDGNDTIYGGEGKDNLQGGNGDDTLYGDEGDDTIYGNEGNDILYGNAGNDTLRGDKGNDTYVFNRGDGQFSNQQDHSRHQRLR